MKVSIATLLQKYEDDVYNDVKPFKSYEKAAKFLYSEYLDIKREILEEGDEDIEVDDVEMYGEDGAKWFTIETDGGRYWECRIITTEME
jgi:hypothetical protein